MGDTRQSGEPRAGSGRRQMHHLQPGPRCAPHPHSLITPEVCRPQLWRIFKCDIHTVKKARTVTGAQLPRSTDAQKRQIKSGWKVPASIWTHSACTHACRHTHACIYTDTAHTRECGQAHTHAHEHFWGPQLGASSQGKHVFPELQSEGCPPKMAPLGNPTARHPPVLGLLAAPGRPSLTTGLGSPRGGSRYHRRLPSAVVKTPGRR